MICVFCKNRIGFKAYWGELVINYLLFQFFSIELTRLFGILLFPILLSPYFRVLLTFWYRLLTLGTKWSWVVFFEIVFVPPWNCKIVIIWLVVLNSSAAVLTVTLKRGVRPQIVSIDYDWSKYSIDTIGDVWKSGAYA